MAIFRKLAKSPSVKTPCAATPAAEALTFEELETAVEAARSQIYSEGTTAHTLEALLKFAEPYVVDGVISQVCACRDVTSQQLTEAIDDVAPLFGVNTVTVAVLKRARNLIARAEALQAADPEYVTRAELDAALDAMGTVFGCAAQEFNQTHFVIGDLIRNLSEIAKQSSSETRPFVDRLVHAVCSYQQPKMVPESYADRMRRQNFGHL